MVVEGGSMYQSGAQYGAIYPVTQTSFPFFLYVFDVKCQSQKEAESI